MRTESRIAVGAGLVLLGAALTTRSFWRWLARVLPGAVASPRDVVAFAPHPSGDGGWSLDRRGNIFAFGSAPEFREVPQPDPWRQGSPFVAIASTPSGRGVWTLDERGNIFAFGDAAEFREVPQPDPWRQGSQFVAIASTPTGRGVWITDRRGRVHSFGDAAELPSPD
jgi:hypothetical protein